MITGFVGPFTLDVALPAGKTVDLTGDFLNAFLTDVRDACSGRVPVISIGSVEGVPVISITNVDRAAIQRAIDDGSLSKQKSATVLPFSRPVSSSAVQSNNEVFSCSNDTCLNPNNGA